MGFEAGKTRLECVGDVEESADLIAYYCDQMELNDGFTKPMNTLGPGRGERQCAPAVRRVGGDFAVQLPAGPRGRPRRWRARGRQHRGVQAGQRHALHRPSPRRDHERGRHPARRVQLRDRRRRHGGPGTDRQPRRGRRGLHRVARHRLPAREGRRRSARSRARSSSRPAARTRRSSCRRPISTRPPTASTARRSGTRARSARRARAPTCTATPARRSSRCSSRRRRRSGLATPSTGTSTWGP